MSKRVFLRISTVCLALIVCTKADAQPKDSDGIVTTGPWLKALHPVSRHVDGSSRTTSASLQRGPDLTIEENRISALYPLTMSVFFDTGSAEIDRRYVLFESPSQTAQFSDTTLPGGTLQKHYHLLNLVGFRMKRYPATTIRLVGANSGEPDRGETRELSRKRAEEVGDYLINVWKIDPKRISLLSPRDLPGIPSDMNDPLGLGAAENRRVEIRSDDYDIVRPVEQHDNRRGLYPDSILFRIGNGMPDEMIANREIEIRWNGETWYVMRNIGISDTLSPAFFWGKENSVDPWTAPNDCIPYTARLVLHTTDGRTLRSDEIAIPVRIRQHSLCCRCFTDSTVERYTLTLFDFDRSDLTPFAEQVIRTMILPNISANSNILITGYTDVIGDEEHNQSLSERRSTAYRTLLERSGIARTRISAHGVGEERPLYRNDLPEGRFYNRTVQVVAVSPRIPSACD